MDTFSIGPKVKNLILYYISATIATMAFKLMSSQYVNEGSHNRLFYHPYMQTFIMFLGESFCLVIFLSNRKKHQIPLQEGKSSHNFTVFFIPSVADVLASTLQYMALNFITGSSFRMFQGGSLITTLIFSKILLNIMIQKRHIWGCGFALIGLLIVGGSGFIEPNSGTGQVSNEFLGYILMLVSLLFITSLPLSQNVFIVMKIIIFIIYYLLLKFNFFYDYIELLKGYHYAYQEMLMGKHSINPLQMVGWQGFFGLIEISLLSLLFSIIPCNLGQSLCVYDNYDHMFLQRVDLFFIQFGSNWAVALLVIVGVVSISATNFSTVTVTKMFDALTACLVGASKTPLVWGIGLIITYSAKDKPEYQLESKNLTVNLVKIGGFLFIIGGTLIYNNLILKNLFADKEGVIHIDQDQSIQHRFKNNQI